MAFAMFYVWKIPKVRTDNEIYYKVFKRNLQDKMKIRIRNVFTITKPMVTETLKTADVTINME